MPGTKEAVFYFKNTP